jgi:hypothetical protein
VSCVWSSESDSQYLSLRLAGRLQFFRSPPLSIVKSRLLDRTPFSISFHFFIFCFCGAKIKKANARTDVSQKRFCEPKFQFVTHECDLCSSTTTRFADLDVIDHRSSIIDHRSVLPTVTSMIRTVGQQQATSNKQQATSNKQQARLAALSITKSQQYEALPE